MSNAQHIPNHIKRVSRYIGYAIWLESPDVWFGLPAVLQARLTIEERAALAFMALKSLDQETACMTSEAAHVRASSQLAAFEPVGVRVMTMHDAKGSEFRAVAVPRLDHNVLPDEGRLLAARDEAHLDEIMTTERHLLYIAATRARDFLWMSGVEPVSEFLSDLAASKATDQPRPSSG